MPRDELPDALILDQLNRLVACNCLGRKSDAEKGTLVVEIQRATRGWSPTELVTATTSLIQSGEKFAGIGSIKLHRAARETPQKAQGSFDVCNACGRHRYYAGFEFPDGTVKPRLRCDCPHAGAGWETEKAKAYVEQDKVLLAAGFGTPPDREEFSA
jgi:hypothetical protein